MKGEVNNQVIDTMFKVFRAMKNTMSFSSKSSHLTMIQFEALLCIKKCKAIQMHDIAKKFDITMPTGTSLIDKLIAMKFVSRTKDEKDRRIVNISLTKEGEKLLQEAMKQRANKINKLLSYLSNSDKLELHRILQTVIGKIETNEK
jgi:MarR family transcriptional regulator, organic hydroperoxide resistance regulator